MVFDYDKFRTPFFEIKVSDSIGKRMVSLPHHILRLIEKVEILETFEKGEGSSITLTILEGSREPGSHDSNIGTEGLYRLDNSSGDRIDMNIAGSITNRPGAVTDMRFSGTSGITFITESEKSTGKIREAQIVNIEGKRVSRKHKGEDVSPVFLFQERNQIAVTWGYREDPLSVRTFRARIKMVQVDFPENAAVRTTITAISAKLDGDQISTNKGVPFGRVKKTSGNNYLIDFEDLTTEELIRDVCNKAGIKCIISDNLPNNKEDRFHQKVWIAGQSFTQFIEELAQKTNSKMEIITNPKTGEDVLVVINKNDLYKRPIKGSGILFNYKMPGTILKSIRVTADFGNIGGAGHTGIDSNGNIASNTTDISSIELFHKKENSNKIKPTVDINPATGTNAVPSTKSIAEKIASGGVTGKVTVNPTRDESGKIKEAADVAAQEALNNTITLEFTCIGYTKVTPGLATFDGLGVRYSGKYEILTVTHIIEPGGYTVTGTAKASSVGKLGVSPQEGNISNDVIKKSKVGLFQKAKNTDALGELRSLQGTN